MGYSQIAIDLGYKANDDTQRLIARSIELSREIGGDTLGTEVAMLVGIAVASNGLAAIGAALHVSDSDNKPDMLYSTTFNALFFALYTESQHRKDGKTVQRLVEEAEAICRRINAPSMLPLSEALG